jgi:hypothetical protein
MQHLHRFASRVPRHPDGGNLNVLCRLSTTRRGAMAHAPNDLALVVLNGHISSSSIVSATGPVNSNSTSLSTEQHIRKILIGQCEYSQILS